MNIPDRSTMTATVAAHFPETGHREAYCACGVPIGNYGIEFFEHLADVIVTSLEHS